MSPALTSQRTFSRLCTVLMSQSPDLQATSEPGSGELEEREEPMPDGEEEAEDDEYGKEAFKSMTACIQP